jgi:hypothetical protein
MRFHADSSFHIGHQHLRTGSACQDYALAGTLVDRAYGVVSDGCSSGGRTDIGARIIALGAAKALREGYKFDPINYILAARPFDIEDSDLWATCLSMSVSEDGASVRIQGDGVVAVVNPDGGLCILKMDWAQNMPCYPAYADDGFKQFVAAQGGPEQSAFQVETWIDNNGTTIQHHRTSDVLDGHQINITGRVRSVAIFSDGVAQISGISWRDAVKELMAFKSLEGDFVKRRMNRFLIDQNKTGSHPIDDIAMAAIAIED